MPQAMFEARIVPASGGTAITVTVPANDPFQAKKIIEAQYGPVKVWFSTPARKR